MIDETTLTRVITESRRRQGLPRCVTDPGTLQRVAQLLLISDPEMEQRRLPAAPRPARSEVRSDAIIVTPNSPRG
jgi:hypothetical protein